MQGGDQWSPYNESRRGSLCRALAHSSIWHYPNSQAATGHPSLALCKTLMGPLHRVFWRQVRAELKQVPMFSSTIAHPELTPFFRGGLFFYRIWKMRYNVISFKISKFAEFTFLLQIRNLSNYMILVYTQKPWRSLCSIWCWLHFLSGATDQTKRKTQTVSCLQESKLNILFLLLRKLSFFHIERRVFVNWLFIILYLNLNVLSTMFLENICTM